MRSFRRQEIVRYETGDRRGYIPPCGEVTIPFEVPESPEPVAHRFRLLGETDYFWRWRTEAGAPYVIAMTIDDALDPRDTHNETYALEFPCHGDHHPRNAYAKLLEYDMPHTRECRLAIAVKSEDLKVGDYASLRLEIYRRKAGRHPDDVFDAPDQVEEIAFPEGTRDWTDLEKRFAMPADAVCLLVRLGVRGCTGRLRVGSPRLYDSECADSYLPPFELSQQREPRYSYLGENLSRRDWLECAILVDGKEIFRGERYSCITRRPEYTFEAGTLAPGKHTFTLRLRNDYATAVGFVLQGLELHTLGNHDFELIGAPETAQEGAPFAALVRTARADVAISANGGAPTLFAEPGLHALKFPPLPNARQEFRLSTPTHTDSFAIERVPAGDRPIHLGTGDDVYIPPTAEELERFVEWYVSEHIGDCICFRHSYRWGGGRSLDPAPWKKIVPLLNELGMHYTVMVDGREVPGMNATPTDDLMQGPGYLGRRAHENDGSFCYWRNQIWGRTEVPVPYGDILSRGVNPGGIQPHIRPVRTAAGKTWWFFDPEKATNVKEASDAFVANLHAAKASSTRHSGPSALFRYFFQAGYECLLAEQMYGPEEVVLAALRGASRAYGKKDFGTHLAVQWGSSPRGDHRQHADRYFLSLATSYLNGATEINLEEGLWRMESNFVDYDRFGECCRLHQEAHERFRRFLERHPRKGELVAPVAVLQGRYDGWRCFGRGNVWENLGDEWRFGKAEESYDLMQKTFYPRNTLDAICRGETPAEPQGWYSGTPHGYADLLPWEGDWSRYRAVVLLGWHTYEPGDDEKLLAYVQDGGTLLLSRRHLSTALRRSAPPEYPANTPALEELLGADWQSAQGLRRRAVGKGAVLFFASDCWPAEDAIRKDYQAALNEIADASQCQEETKGWIRANEDIEFAAYEQPDGSREFYLLNIRWWDHKPATATLCKGGATREIEVPFGEIVVRS